MKMNHKHALMMGSVMREEEQARRRFEVEVAELEMRLREGERAVSRRVVEEAEWRDWVALKRGCFY